MTPSPTSKFERLSPADGSALAPGDDCWVVWQDGLQRGKFCEWASLTAPGTEWKHAIVALMFNGEAILRRIHLENLYGTRAAADAGWRKAMKAVRDALNRMAL